MTGCLHRVFQVCLVCALAVPLRALSQDNTYSKDGAVLYALGAGYHRMGDAYSPRGLALGVQARFYGTDRLFCEVAGHWGLHDGEKRVMQAGKPSSVRDERSILLAAAGAGYELLQSDSKCYDVYVKGLAGYAFRFSDYDGYSPVGPDDGRITRGCTKNRQGIAAIAGIGADARFGSWVFSPSVDVIYACGRIDVALMVSIGLLGL